MVELDRRRVIHCHRVILLNYGIMTTPAIVVDGEVKLKGHVPTESEIKKILGI